VYHVFYVTEEKFCLFEEGEKLAGTYSGSGEAGGIHNDC
jgi:hypothetical protein